MSVGSIPDSNPGLIKPVNKNDYSIKEGLVNNIDNKCNGVVGCGEVMTICPEPMDVEKVETFYEPGLAASWPIVPKPPGK